MPGKKKRVPPQRTKNAFAKRIKKHREQSLDIMQAWTAQLALDTIAIVLNDPKVMGHDVFGAKRLEKVCAGFNAAWPDHILAILDHDESDYWRTKIDQALARIYGPSYLHWQERYPWWDKNDTY